MDGADSSLFGSATTVRLEQLAVLRRQRMRLGALCDEVDTARRMFNRAGGAEVFRSWRSAAAHGYAARQVEVKADLDLSVVLLNDALESIERAIAELKALL